MRPTLFIALLAGATSLMFVGCAQDAEPPEHVHHEFPEHRPANLKEAVDALKLRSWELANRGGKIGSLEFGHFVDIIGWVPEMAADSDLKKADWESANTAAEHMKSSVLSRDLDIRKLEEVVADDLKTLEALVPKAGKPEPNLMNQHHDHDDH